MDPYDISRIFVQMEYDLIASMKRNFARHLAEEEKEGFEWEQWQKRKLQALARYRAENKKLIHAAGEMIDQETEALLQDSFRQGGKNVDETLKHLFIAGKLTRRIAQMNGTDDSFFKVNEKRVNALIKAVTQDLQKARYAMLRQADDIYRQTIFKSQLYLNSGAASLGQAIDMATKDFLDRGFNCIVYKDGRRVNIASYAEMALRASSQRAVFTGEGARRGAWGVHTVVVSSHNNCSPLCLPWQGKVYIDDVYSGGKKGQGDYPLLSTAMNGGLFHPHCRHNTGTYLEGISSLPEPVDDEKASANYEAEQKQRYMERQVRRYKRHEVGDVDPKNQAEASAKVREWQGKIREHLAENNQLRRDPRREQIQGGLSPKQRNEVLKNEAAYAKYKKLLGDDIPDRAAFETMQSNKDWPLVQLDYQRRNKLLENPELALPNAVEATAADAKFTKYLFNPENKQGAAKGAAFTSRLGYNADNWQELQQEILKRAALNPVLRKGANAYGDLYEQKMILYGKQKRPANAVVSWIKEENSTKMTSAYIKEVKADAED